MSYNLFIDDERLPADVFSRGHDWSKFEWVIARSNTEAFGIVLSRGVPERMSLDFCLDQSCYELVTSFIRIYRTSFDVMPEYNVHSRNPYAKQMIDELVKSLDFTKVYDSGECL